MGLGKSWLIKINNNIEISLSKFPLFGIHGRIKAVHVYLRVHTFDVVKRRVLSVSTQSCFSSPDSAAR